jgi:uncharacterized protein YjhX (UPF0386 family)
MYRPPKSSKVLGTHDEPVSTAQTEEFIIEFEKYVKRPITNQERFLIEYQAKDIANGGRIEYSGDSEIEIKVRCYSRGHWPPIKTGSLVKLRKIDNKERSMTLFEQLEFGALEYAKGVRKYEMQSTDTAMICESRWLHPTVVHDEIHDSRLRQSRSELFYRLIINSGKSTGLFWARFDWIEEITPASEME